MQLIQEFEHAEHIGACVISKGLLLENIGLSSFIEHLLESYLAHIAAFVYSHTLPLRSHQSFVVKYEPGHQAIMSTHIDESDITFNVCLGEEFTGSALYFVDKRRVENRYVDEETFSVQHKPGRLVVHLGNAHHGVKPIISGCRYNMVVWCKR